MVQTFNLKIDILSISFPIDKVIRCKAQGNDILYGAAQSLGPVP